MRNIGRFDVLLGLVSEQSMEQNWFKLRNFLQAFNAVAENFLDKLNYRFRVFVEGRNQLSCLRRKKIELEKRFRVLVLSKLFVEPLLALLDTC